MPHSHHGIPSDFSGVGPRWPAPILARVPLLPLLSALQGFLSGDYFFPQCVTNHEKSLVVMGISLLFFRGGGGNGGVVKDNHKKNRTKIHSEIYGISGDCFGLVRTP